MNDSFVAPSASEWADEDLDGELAPSPAERAHLLAHFDPMITRLEELLERDLSAWRS